MICSRCSEDKPTTAFRGHHVQCRACEAAAESERYRADRLAQDALVFARLDDKMIAFGLDIERECARAVLQLGDIEKATVAVGLAASVIRAHLSRLLRRAARAGWAPASDMKVAQPDGFHVKGVSTYYDANGKVKGQWVKSAKDEDVKYLELIEAAKDAFLDGVAVPSINRKVEFKLLDDLLVVYPMGDPHIGMFAWGEESGADFDLKIAERNLCAAVDHLVAGTPAAREALIINLGDYFHADNSSNQTSRSHHALDVDTRWAKVLRVGLRAFRRCIDRCLEKHERVRVICEIGNHDDHSAIMLALALEAAYESNPRVTIDTSPSKYHWYEFDSVMIVTTHTDSIKMSDVPGVMAQDQPEMWGRTKFRYGHTGHRHQDALVEKNGALIECHRTLAPRDAWSAGKGYGSGRSMKAIVYHRKFGEVSRNTVGILQLQE